jgi:hypothetical protein
VGVGSVVVLLGGGLVWDSNPCPSYGWTNDLLMGLAGPALVAMGLLYVVYAVRRRILVGLLLGAACVTYVAVLPHDLPFKLRWRLSRPAFEAWTAHNRDAQSGEPRRLGLFWHPKVVKRSEDGAVGFDLSQGDGCRACTICLACGVVWLPSVARDDSGLEPLGGGWYWYRECT